MISLPSSFDINEIEKMVNILNERLVGVPLVDLKNKIYKEVALLLSQHIHNYESIVSTLAESFTTKSLQKYFLAGKRIC